MNLFKNLLSSTATVQTVPRLKRQKTTIFKPVRIKAQGGYKHVNRPVMTWISVPDNRLFFVRKASEIYRSLSKSLKIIAIAPVLLFSFNYLWQKLRPFYGSLYSIQSLKQSIFKNDDKESHQYSIKRTITSPFQTSKQIKHFSDYWHIKNPPASGRVVAQNYLTDMIISLFRNKSIEREGLNFLERLFKQDQTHKAGLFLLKNVLKDPAFVDESKVFGKDLVGHIVQTKQCKDQFKQLILDVLKKDQVKKQSVEIVKFLVHQQRTKELMATFFKGVFLRDDIKDSLNNLFTKAAFVTLQQQINQQRFGEFILKVVGDKKVQEGIYTSMMKPVKSRVYSTLTLGLYSGGESNSSNSSEKKEKQVKALSKDVKIQ